MIAVIYVADHPRLHGTHRRLLVRLDAAYMNEAELVARLEDLLDADVANVVVTEVDLVCDVTEVDVRYRLRAAGASSDTDADTPPGRALAVPFGRRP